MYASATNIFTGYNRVNVSFHAILNTTSIIKKIV